MDYINTSHPNFIGGSKALEAAAQQTKSSTVSLPVSKVKVHVMWDPVQSYFAFHTNCGN